MEVNIFSKKSALVLNWLLTAGVSTRFSTNGLARTLSVSVQTVHKVISYLVEEGLVAAYGRATGVEYELSDPTALLERWAENYSIHKKCKIQSYKATPLGFDEVEKRLLKANLESYVMWALHSALAAQGKAIVSKKTMELYVLEDTLLSTVEDLLQLESTSDSYNCVLIRPYYNQLAQRALPKASQKGIQPTPQVLTYLDLYHYKFRGLEAAESLSDDILPRPKKIKPDAKDNILNILKLAYKALPNLKSQGVVVGGVALLLYTLKEDLSTTPVVTTDIDIGLQRKTPGLKKAHEKLEDMGFSHKFKGLEEPPTESFEMVMDHQTYELEFLTDAKTRSKTVPNVKIGSLVAQPLKFLEISQKYTMSIEIDKKFKVKVVTPGAWLFHKGLTFNRRRAKSSKYYKDLYGIWYLCTQLKDSSEQATFELLQLKKQYPSWGRSFDKNLKRFVFEASPADWRALQAQDISENLKKADFVKTIQSLLPDKVQI